MHICLLTILSEVSFFIMVGLVSECFMYASFLSH